MSSIPTRTSGPAPRSAARRALTRERRGTVLVQVGIMLVAMVGFGAVAVEFSGHHVVATELQTVADAAALSAARTLQASALADPSAAARTRAVATGQANAVQAGDGPIATGDVEIGCYLPTTGAFSTTLTSGCPDRNAARVTVQKTGQVWMSSVFQRVYNLPLPTIRKQATAWIANIVATNCVRPYAMPYNALYTLAHGSAPSPATTPLTQADLVSLNAKSDAQRLITVLGPGVGATGGAVGNWFAFSYTGNAGQPGYQQGISVCNYDVIAVDGSDGVTLPGNDNQKINRTTEAMTTVFQSQGDTYQPYCAGNTNSNSGCYSTTGVLGKDTKVAWGVPDGTGSNTVNFMVFSKFTILCYVKSTSQTCPATGQTNLPEGTIIGRVWQIVPGTVDPDDVLGNTKSLAQRLILVK